MASAEEIDEFDPLGWERVDAMVSLGCAADQDVAALGEALSAAVRDLASAHPDDGGMASDGACPRWPLRAALLRQPMTPGIEAEVVARSARTGQDLPPRLLVYYMGLLMLAGAPTALSVDRALVRARNALATVPGAQGVAVLRVPPRPEVAAALAEDDHFAV
jgi:hypothetical protein